MIEIDGSFGEGGGQIIRTSLALSALTGKPVNIKNIRAARSNPGLRPQHLASVRTLASICNAELLNAEPGSQILSFSPKAVCKADFKVNIGTAGSISLLISQILPVALLSETKLLVLGGTNVPFSPPIEFLKECLFPALKQMKGRFNTFVSKRGYYPKGGGAVSFSSKPAHLPLKAINLTEPVSIEFVKIFSHCYSLPKSVALNQVSSAKYELKNLNAHFEESIECKEDSETTGSGISIFAKLNNGLSLSGSALGSKAIPAEKVGKQAATMLLKQLSSKMPCDSFLADQLIPFMALAKGKSEIKTGFLSQHCLSNIAIVEKFLPVSFSVNGKEKGPASISVEGISFKGR